MKLTFPWLSDDYVSDWARTVQPGAGKDRGAMVLPEVGDEVLVAFEQGDIRRPYVLGGLYNGVDTPQAGGPIDDVDGGSGAINRRSLVSRRGHRIDLLDEDGRTEGITLATGDGKLQLTLDAIGTKVTVHSDGSVTDRGQERRHRRRGAAAKLELKGGDVSITATTGRHARRRHRRGEGATRLASATSRSARAPRGQGRMIRADQRSLVRSRKEDDDATSSPRRRPDRAPGRHRAARRADRAHRRMPAATVGTPHICSFPPPRCTRRRRSSRRAARRC